MKERTKLILGGFWMAALVIVSLVLFEYYKNKYDNHYIVVLWAFAFLAGMQLSSWSALAHDFNERRKQNIVNR